MRCSSFCSDFVELFQNRAIRCVFSFYLLHVTLRSQTHDNFFDKAILQGTRMSRGELNRRSQWRRRPTVRLRITTAGDCKVHMVPWPGTTVFSFRIFKRIEEPSFPPSRLSRFRILKRVAYAKNNQQLFTSPLLTKRSIQLIFIRKCRWEFKPDSTNFSLCRLSINENL